VRPQIGTHLFEGIDYARLHVQRVQAVQEQQVREQFVLGKNVEDPLPLLPLSDHVHHACQTLTVEFQKNPYYLRSFGPGVRVLEGFDLL
jgi:hypothetical protein